MNCKLCGKETYNLSFCSRSCSAKFNNKKYPKKEKKVYFCILCEKEILPQRKYCVDCRNKLREKAKHSRGKSTYEYMKKSRRDLKLFAVNYLGNQCSICGYKKCLRALVFHHKNPTEKDFQIGTQSFYTLNKKELMVELDKCILVCANCHAELHDIVSI